MTRYSVQPCDEPDGRRTWDVWVHGTRCGARCTQAECRGYITANTGTRAEAREHAARLRARDAHNAYSEHVARIAAAADAVVAANDPPGSAEYDAAVAQLVTLAGTDAGVEHAKAEARARRGAS